MGTQHSPPATSHQFLTILTRYKNIYKKCYIGHFIFKSNTIFKSIYLIAILRKTPCKEFLNAFLRLIVSVFDILLKFLCEVYISVDIRTSPDMTSLILAHVTGSDDMYVGDCPGPPHLLPRNNHPTQAHCTLVWSCRLFWMCDPIVQFTVLSFQKY